MEALTTLLGALARTNRIREDRDIGREAVEIWRQLVAVDDSRVGAEPAEEAQDTPNICRGRIKLSEWASQFSKLIARNNVCV